LLDLEEQYWKGREMDMVPRAKEIGWYESRIETGKEGIRL